MIDAHAGGIGTVGARGGSGAATTRMAYVFGTSACTMASSTEPVFIPGVWGPYKSAMVPELWLSEGGQSGAGAAIEQLICLHPAAAEARETTAAAGISLATWLADAAAAASASASEAILLAGGLHVVPDFLGNRSPLADPDARAVIAGLGMERDLTSLIALYIAGMLGLGYGLRQIILASRKQGAGIDSIVLSGGGGRHPLVRQLIADCAGLPVLIPDQPEPVLLGAAMLGAVASGSFPTVETAMHAMSSVSETFEPIAGEIAQLHENRFAAFEKLQQTARELRAMR